jgi:thiamine kinase-like enzyme
MPADCDVPTAPCTETEPQFLGKTSITADHVQLAFREYFKDDQLTLVKADGQTIAAGQGFTSYIVRVNLEWTDEEKKRHPLPKSAILKALSKDALELLFQKFDMKDDDTGRNEFMNMLGKSHKNECMIYQLFGTSGPVPLARCYTSWLGDASRPPLLLLEDLGDRARVLGDGSASLTYDQILQLAEAQASLHAWCLTTDTEWRNKFETIQDRMAMFSTMVGVMKQGLQKARATLSHSIIEKLDEEKLSTVLLPENMVKVFQVYEAWMPEVLVHGDFWANNIMFEKLPDGSMGPKLAAFIDWQIPTRGNPMHDLGRVLSMSLDYDLRHKHMEDIIKRYYDTLVKKTGDRMPKDLTYDRVRQMANEQTAMSYLMFLCMRDALCSMLFMDNDPEAEVKREKMTKRIVDGCEFAMTVFDITSS